MAYLASLISLALGAALFGVVTRTASPALAWLALIALVHAERSMRVVPGMLLLWAALGVSFAVTRRATDPIGGAAYFGVMAAEAAIVTLAFAFDRVAAPMLSGVRATLVFPLALTAIEFLRSRLAPPATWGSIAYSQYGFPAMMQVAAVAGLWGITFLVAWGASTADFTWSRAWHWSAVRGPLLCCGGLLAAALLGGSLRLGLAPTDGAVVRAATLNRPSNLFAPGEITRIVEDRVADGEQARVDGKLARLHDWFLDGTRREARAGARLVAWPEQGLLVHGDDESAFLERARRLAREERVSIAMGMAVVHHGDALPFENKLVLIDRSGEIVLSHLKTRPVAGWEAGIMKRGTVPVRVVAIPEGRVAGAVCFEADFPELTREAGRQRADLAVVVANDWPAIKAIHFQMHAFRAIENGMSLLRPAAAGLSAAIDPWGRVVAVSDFFAPGDGTMVAQVPMGHVPTLYARWGDWFGWLSIAGLALVLATLSLQVSEPSAASGAPAVAGAVRSPAQRAAIDTASRSPVPPQATMLSR